MMRYCILNYCTNEILHPGKYQLLRGFVVYVVYTRSGAFDSMASRGTSMYIHVLLYGLKGDIHLHVHIHVQAMMTSWRHLMVQSPHQRRGSAVLLLYINSRQIGKNVLHTPTCTSIYFCAVYMYEKSMYTCTCSCIASCVFHT